MVGSYGILGNHKNWLGSDGILVRYLSLSFFLGGVMGIRDQ